MQPSAAYTPSPIAQDFADVLAQAAAPGRKFPPAREVADVEPDFATLSYEHALRRHARYRATATATQPPQPMAEAPAAASERGAMPRQSAADRLKRASVTIRFTAPESEQLRLRAAEAGLTLSEYMRSCVFEVEKLRTQVKETVAALRASAPAPAPRAGFWVRLAAWFRRAPAPA